MKNKDTDSDIFSLSFTNYLLQIVRRCGAEVESQPHTQQSRIRFPAERIDAKIASWGIWVASDV